MTLIAALWMRFNSAEEAESVGKKYAVCPKVHFWGNSGDEAYIVLKVPKENRFWSDYIGSNPENTFGGTEARLEYIDSVHSQEIKISYERVEGDTAPCGVNCLTCPSFGTCSGCPALSLGSP